MRPQSEQDLRMQKAASKAPVCGGYYPYVQNSIRAIALEVLQHNEHITSKRKLKRLVREQVRSRLKRKNHSVSFIGWQVVLMWILPTLI